MCHGAGPPSFPNCKFRFLGPPGFGGNDQAAKKDRGLAASTKNREEGWGSLVDVECIKIKRRKVLSNIRLVNIPTGFFVVDLGGRVFG